MAKIQNYFNIHIIGIASLLLTLAIPISPVIFISLSAILMIFYIFIWFKSVYKGNHKIQFIKSDDIFIKLNIPKFYFPFIIRMCLVIFLVLYNILFERNSYEFIFGYTFILIFGLLELYTFRLSKNNFFYLSLNNESIESQEDYTNRIYYSEIKNIIWDNKNKIILESTTGNSIRIDIRKIPNELRMKLINRLDEKTKQNDLKSVSQILEEMRKEYLQQAAT